ncbi:MAG: hypothetical protein ACREIF_15225 [Chthoniobacterales bacterium]
MLGAPIRSEKIGRGLMILLGAVALGSCSTNEPNQTALVGDPDAGHTSSIPWNKPQGWEGSAGLPAGLNGANGNPNPNNPLGY